MVCLWRTVPNGQLCESTYGGNEQINFHLKHLTFPYSIVKLVTAYGTVRPSLPADLPGNNVRKRKGPAHFHINTPQWRENLKVTLELVSPTIRWYSETNLLGFITSVFFFH